jgi:hypothetical protein
MTGRVSLVCLVCLVCMICLVCVVCMVGLVGLAWSVCRGCEPLKGIPVLSDIYGNAGFEIVRHCINRGDAIGIPLVYLIHTLSIPLLYPIHTLSVPYAYQMHTICTPFGITGACPGISHAHPFAYPRYGLSMH